MTNYWDRYSYRFWLNTTRREIIAENPMISSKDLIAESRWSDEDRRRFKRLTKMVHATCIACGATDVLCPAQDAHRAYCGCLDFDQAFYEAIR